MSPSVSEISRLTSFSAVVLPQPDGPTSTQISPGRDLEAEPLRRRLARGPDIA